MSTSCKPRKVKKRRPIKRDPRLDCYAVQFVPIGSIKPSPENNDIYGEIEHDDDMDNLIGSIRENGLEQPLLITQDNYVLSGHRRLYALEYLGYTEVPVTYSPVCRENNPEYHRHLAAYNPQRTKTVASVLKEILLRDNDAESTYDAIEERREASMRVDADFMKVDGSKNITPISGRRQEFLEAVQQVIDDLEDYHPLSIRQIHYRLLNNPPLKQTPKRSKFKDNPEHYRYKNDDSSYNSLVDLLGPARYNGQISMSCIDDPTRPQMLYGGDYSVQSFVREELDNFLVGFNRDRQDGQPRHIEVFAEKNTLYQMMNRACSEYYVPFTIGRGFCSIPVWRDIARRFRDSGKERMTLIIISDYDPAGLELADDAIKSLKLLNVPVDGHRIAVNREQIDELGLAEDFNPAKPESTNLKAFIERTGGKRTWEVEALPPDYIVDQVKAAIEANMDMEIYEGVCEEEEDGCGELCRIKEELATQMVI